MFWFVYNLMFHGVYLLMLPKFLLRMRRRGGYRKGFAERWFRVSEEKRHALSDGRKIWVHAVSVGELGVGLAFMREWRRRYPETQFLVTVNTSTAHRLAEEKLEERDVLLYPPVDSPWVIRRVLKCVRPEALVLVETEMWPNLLRGMRKAGVPVMLLNGRVSDRSFARLRRIRWMTRRLYSLVDLYAVQSASDAERVKWLGASAERVEVMHSAKYDLGERDEAEEQKRRARLKSVGFLDEASTVILGSSTWPGEERVLMEALKALQAVEPSVRLILVPRHFERREEVLTEARDLDVTMVCWSSASDEELGGADVVMVDTTGELRHFTGFADRVFVGKSLYRSEGQNPLEAAHAGKWIVTGPGMDNFRQIMADLRQADAVAEAGDAQDLVKRLAASLQDNEGAAAQGERARALVESRKGSLGRSAEALSALIDRSDA